MKEDIIERLGKKVLRKFIDTDITSIITDKSEERSEGDIWIEDGKEWSLNNGVIISRKHTLSSNLPHFCTKCNKTMKHELDDKTYEIHNHCYNCQCEYETTLKIEGRYEEYENKLVNANIDSMISQLQYEKLEFLENLSETNKIFNGEGLIIDETDISALNIEMILKNFEDKENYLKSCKQT